LGLLINELVSNSLKYAFEGLNRGLLTVSLKEENDGQYLLRVADNGVGFPEEIDFKNTDSLGLQLVNNLVGQLDGEITLDSSGGTDFTVRFQEQKYKNVLIQLNMGVKDVCKMDFINGY